MVPNVGIVNELERMCKEAVVAILRMCEQLCYW